VTWNDGWPSTFWRVELPLGEAEALDRDFDNVGTRAVADAVFSDWKSLQRRLRGAVEPHPWAWDRRDICLVTATRHAALPWESALPDPGSFTIYRGVSGGEAPPRSEGRRSVLLITPEGLKGRGGRRLRISEDELSGFSMEQLYLSSAPRSDFVRTLSAPDTGLLTKVLTAMRPQVVHIIGQVFESSSGTYLDFAGADARLFGEWVPHEGSLDSHRLSRYFQRLCPVVILDITAPDNITDIVRMLLLRNRFAAELYEADAARAVLATGLTPPHAREALARTLVGGVRENATLGQMWRSLRGDANPAELADLMGRYSSALFAHDPTVRLFAEK
jgi:hypothetical protein